MFKVEMNSKNSTTKQTADFEDKEVITGAENKMEAAKKEKKGPCS